MIPDEETPVAVKVSVTARIKRAGTEEWVDVEMYVPPKMDEEIDG